MTSLSIKEENYVRMGLLLTGISPRAVRALFDQEFHPSGLNASIKKEYNKLLEMKKKKIINQPQWNLLFPRFPDVPMSSTFDVTLIITLLRNLTDVISPHGGFEKLPTSIETTNGSDLARLKFYRNYLAHLDDAKIDNVFFVSAWNDISEAIGRLGGQSLKQECDQLKTKTLDQTNQKIILEIKNSKSEIEELKKLVKVHESEMKILKAEQDEVIPKNIRDQINKQLEDWEERDQMFVSTRASDYVMKCLQDNSCITITGSAGVGKSFIARHSALVLRKEGYSIIPVVFPSDIRVYYQSDKRTVFIVDDICGNFTANQEQIESWKQLLPVIQLIVEDNYCKIIVSCRLQVYKDDKFNILSPFKSCECNLISNELCLTAEERNDIADLYIGTNSKNLDEEAKLCEFFPLLCYLYDKKKNVDVNEYFKNPFVVYKDELDKLSKCGDEGKYKVCSLALCVIFNNRLEEEWFKGKVTDQQRQIIEDTCDTCGLNRSTSKAKLNEALSTLEGTFICKYHSTYKTIHDKLFDFLVYYFGQKMIECLIDHCDKYLIEERFIWQDSPDDKDSNTEFMIEITDEYLEAYLKRLIREWSAGRVTFVFNSKCLKNASCRQHLLQYLKQLEQSQQVSLINTKDTIKKKYDIHQSGDYPLIRACKLGYTDMVQWMLHNEVDVDQCRDDGVTGLIMASQQGFTTILNLLIEKKPNVNLCNNEGWNPLYMASMHGHTDIVRLLLKTNPNVDQCTNTGWSPLCMASCYGHTDIVSLLLEKNPNFDQCDDKGWSPLYIASSNGHTDIVRLLLEKNHDVDQCDNSGFSPLCMASCYGHTDIVSLLLEKNPNFDQCDDEGWNPLYMASGNGHTAIVRLLLEKNHDVNLCDNNGRSPLNMAIEKGYIDIVKLLLEKNPNVNLCENNGRSPLNMAIEKGYIDIVKLLLEKNPNVNLCDNNGYSPLYLTIMNRYHPYHIAYFSSDVFITSNDQIDIVQLILLHGGDINAQTCDGGHALFFSTLTGNLELTQFLLENNADCNICIYNKEYIRDTYHKRTLFERNICQTLMELLSSKMKDFVSNKVFELDVLSNRKQNVTNNYLFPFSSLKKPNYVVLRLRAVDYVFGVVAGSSPLHIACFMGETKVVRCLLEYKANINLAKVDGTNPLHNACELGHDDIVQILLEKNANVDICDNDGLTPLIKSCLNNNTSTVKLLITYKPDINARTVDGTNALFFSAFNGNLEITKLLLENNADCNNCIHSKQVIIESPSGDPEGTKLDKMLDLFVILESCTTEYITEYVSKQTLDYVFDVFAGSSSLHVACFMGRLDVVRCLLENKANINQANGHGATPLSYACAVGHTDIVNTLLEKNANVDTCDNDGFTPLIKACTNNHTSVVKLLIQHNPDINARGSHGFNALFCSAMNGNLEIVELLLKSSADCNICTDSKEFIKDDSANHTTKAFKQIQPYLLNILNNSFSFANNYDTDSDRVFKRVFDLVTCSTPLHIACFIGAIDVVRCLIEHKAYIDMVKENGETSLYNACKEGHTDIVKLLLEKNANVNICKHDRGSPLNIASTLGHTDIVRMLLEKNSYVDQCFKGQSSLYSASYAGHTDIVKLLLEKNANVNLCINNGLSPLHVAIIYRQTDTVKLLLEKNPNVDLFETEFLETALWRSCYINDYDIVKMLIKHNPDINAQAIDGSCALFLSALNGNVDILRLLLENNADCNICCHNKQYLIDKLTNYLDIDILTQNIYVSYLWRTYSINCLDYVRKNMSKSKEYAFDVVTGSSPLHIACFKGLIHVVRCLLKHKANINMAKEDGTTPLFYACEVGHEDIVQLLLDNGANTQMCTLDGKSPFDIATDNGHESVIIMLRKHSEDQHTVCS